MAGNHGRDWSRTGPAGGGGGGCKGNLERSFQDWKARVINDAEIWSFDVNVKPDPQQFRLVQSIEGSIIQKSWDFHFRVIMLVKDKRRT